MTDLTDGNVKECISGDCVDINDICSGVDSCSSMENDWFCTGILTVNIQDTL